MKNLTEEMPTYRNVLNLERVAAYVRVSSQEQKLHGLSLDAQVQKLEQYAEANGMKIVEWYKDEGVSGRKLIRNRPELQRMIQDAEQGKFERILFIKLDRFFRSVAEYHECMKRISPVIWTATEEKYDLSTAQGRMLVNMKLTVAEMEADMAGERVSIVNEYKTSTGQPLSGSMPFGFKIDRDPTTGRKKVVKHPEQKAILEDVLQYIFTHHSKRKAVIYLHSKYHISMSYNSLSNLLSNTLLCGEYRDNPNYCEGYLTHVEFNKLQAICKSNVKHNSIDRDYIFSGLIKCPCCGNKLAGGVHRCKNRYGTAYQYKKYRCMNSNINSRCSFKIVVNERVLERKLLENIEQYFEDAKIRSVQVTDSDATKIYEYDIEAIHQEIDRLNYSWQTGKIKTVEKYEAQYDKLMQRLEAAEAERGEVHMKDFTKIEGILQSGWREIYHSLDDAHKRAFWRSFITSIEVNWTYERKEIARVNFF